MKASINTLITKDFLEKNTNEVYFINTKNIEVNIKNENNNLIITLSPKKESEKALF
ncbi:hypothetical protein OSC52_15215 [Clostridium pasteurianum]|uniref:hypothetical protein n=1 Tax=Clostridium pasteurianum TaxID=1501 RepID=UPI002260CB2A|nr:hypothetical protein [Clostridium pasteurianum]UZW13186.1 hypothetical protein OSC52_15215 [Clostridium pasteurianum]